VIQKLLIALCLMCVVDPALAAGRGYLGASFENLPDTEKEVQTGVVVKKVFADMAAQQAGLKTGEIITQINGVFAPDPQAAIALLAENAAGQTVRLTVIDRTGAGLRRSFVLATLGAKPTEEFAQIMVAPPPCRLTAPSTVRHCVGPARKRARWDRADVAVGH
jgi:predicted metalloprotease with PDZ domain